MSTMKNNKTKYKTEDLQRHISQTKSINDLLLVIPDFPLNAIKTFVTEQIKTMDLNQIRMTYYKLLSINYIFSDDILQTILSFNSIYHPRTVCKKWAQLSIQNETNQLKQIYRSVANTLDIYANEHKNRDIWVVHPTRIYLHPIEKELGLKGPINVYPYCEIDGNMAHDARDTEHFENMINQKCKDGDTLLLHNGNYWKWKGFKIHRHLQFIGVGNNVVFHKIFSDPSSALIDIIRSSSSLSRIHVHFENVTFDCPKKLHSTRQRKCIVVRAHNTLSLKNCKLMTSGTGINVDDHATIDIQDCQFVGHYELSGNQEMMSDAKFGIYVSGAARNVEIKHCSFHKFYDPNEACIFIDTTDLDDDSNHGSGDNNTFDLKLMHNVFEDNNCPPIVEKCIRIQRNDGRCVDLNADKKYSIENNTLRGEHVGENANTITKKYEIWPDDSDSDSDLSISHSDELSIQTI